jgi:hypothetical protein
MIKYKKIMKMKNILLILILCLIVIVNKSNAQFGVDGVSYKLKYNTDSCWYDAYLVINAGSATTVTERIQFNGQLTLVVPAGTKVTIPRGYMPLINNSTPGTGTYATNYWGLSSAIFAPTITPTKDYRAITPNLFAGTAYYNELHQGDEVKLFSVRLTPMVKCSKDIRLYINGSDPTSADPGMGGSDFSNEFTIQSMFNQIYDNNAPQVYPPVPFIDPDPIIGCGNGIEIDITTSTSGCQTPLSYAWTGPSSFTSISEDVFISPATAANEGWYKVIATDSLGCKDSLQVEAFKKPSAGPDKVTCAGTSVNVSGTSPTSGTWSALPTNPPGATINPGVDGNASIAFSNLSSGVYKFKYATPLCSDTMQITVNAKAIVGLSTPAICANLTTTLISNQTGTWVSNSPSIASVTSSGLVTSVNSGLVSFTFTNPVTGCQSTTANLTVNPEPIVTLNTDTICIGSTALLTPKTGGTWTSTVPSVATVTNLGLATGVAAGITKLVYRESLSPNCVSDTLVLTVFPRPSTTLTGPNLICIGGTTTFTPSSGGTWNATDPTIATITNGGLVTGVLAGTVTFVYTQSGTDCVSNPSTPITVQAKPTLGGVPATPRCIGTILTLTATPAGGTWVSNNPASASVVASTGVVTTYGSGIIDFSYISSLGCTNTTSKLTLLPRPSINSILPAICVGRNTTISPNPALGTGTWTNLTPTKVSRSGATVTGISEGVAKLLFTETATTCVSDTLKITVNPRPIITLTGNDSICVGSTATITPSTGGAWSSANNSIATINNSGIVTGVSPGFTYVVYTSTSTGCASDPSASITVLPLPTVGIAGSDSICIGNTTTLSPTTGGTWANSNPAVANATNGGAVTGVSPGIARFIFTETTLGCQSLATPILMVMPNPVIALTGPTKITVSKTTTLSANTTGHWTSLNPDIATIDSTAGIVTGRSKGMAGFQFVSIVGCSSNLLYVEVTGYSYEITGFCFTDINANGIFDDNIDFPLPNVNINIDNDSITYYTNNNGYFNIPVDSGMVVMNNTINFGNWVNDSIVRNLAITKPRTFVFIGFVPSSTGGNPSGLAAASSSTANCKKFANLYAQAFNASSQVVDGYLIVEYDPRSYVSISSPLPSGGKDNYLVWTFSDLPPGRTFSPDIEYWVPDAISNMDSLHFTVRMVDISTGDTLSSFVLAEEIKCNGNVNMDRARTWPDRAGEDNYTLVGEAITYNLAFTNKGSSAASAVTIKCDIDANLNLNTLKIQKASHNFDVTSEDGTLKFYADSLTLAASNRDDNSEVYVNFTLNAKANLTEKTVLYMNAEASMNNGYKDRSNTVINTIVGTLPCDLINDEISQVGNSLIVTKAGTSYTWYDCKTGLIVSSAGQLTLSANGKFYCVIEGKSCKNQTDCFEFIYTGTEDNLENLIKVYPNPVNDMLYIDTESEGADIVILDLMGRALMHTKEKSLSVKELTNGMYMIRIKSKETEVVRRFVKS